MHIEFIKNGDVFTTSSDIIMKTELGSCVSLCLWDAEKKSGGMNHYLLPYRNEIRKSPSEFGDHANRVLIQAMLRSGSRMENLRALIFGGASLRLLSDHFRVGEQNILIAEEIVKAYKIPILHRFVGGNLSRSIRFINKSGLIDLKEIEMNTGISYNQTLRLR